LAVKELLWKIEDSRPTGDSVQEVARLEDWKRLRLMIVEEINELARIVYRADNTEKIDTYLHTDGTCWLMHSLEKDEWQGGQAGYNTGDTWYCDSTEAGRSVGLTDAEINDCLAADPTEETQDDN
jgi:hypothetical protein